MYFYGLKRATSWARIHCSLWTMRLFMICKSKIDKNFEYIKNQVEELDIFKVVYEDTKEIEAIATKFEKYKDILIFATGGSSLGGKTLSNYASSILKNRPRIHYVENVDSRSFLTKVGLCDPKNTGIIVISKSGKTTETLMLFLTILELWAEFDYKNDAAVITEDSSNNDLRCLAIEKGIPIIDHGKNIGGRFSVFSVVGLLPALIAGLDIKKFLDGARKVLNTVKMETCYEKCEVFKEATNQYKSFKKGIDQHVLLLYSDHLSDLGSWFCQLVAESLGKSQNFGITPLSFIGTVDQHSMLQLFLDGPRNKYYSMVTQKENISTSSVKPSITSPVINTLNGHKINDLMVAHQLATAQSLKQRGPLRLFEFDSIDAETFGHLMMTFVLETVIIAKLAGVDPFNQPGVEETKKFAIMHLNAME